MKRLSIILSYRNMNPQHSDQSERFPLYLTLEGPDVTIHLDDFGIEMNNKMCGLFSLYGTLNLRDFASLSSLKKRLFLCSDLVQNKSILSGGRRLPVLREIFLGSGTGKIQMDFSKVLWLDTSDNVLRSVRMYITDGEGNIPAVAACSLTCTLLLFDKTR